MKQFIIRKTETGWINTLLYKQHLDSLPEGNYKIGIEKSNKRSNPQNSYYWAVVVPLVYDGLREAGFDSVRTLEDTHEVIKSLFLKVRQESNGMEIERIKSTTELNKESFGEFLDQINAWAYDYLGVNIPAPNEQLEFQIMNP